MSSTAGDAAPTRPEFSEKPVSAISARWAFLSPEDTVICREPAELMRRLAEGFASSDELLAFVAANRLALEAFRSRERELAAEVCQLEIEYAAARLAAGGDWQLAMMGLQPVINLIRLHGYTGDLDLARRGLAALEAIADGEAVSFGGLDLDAGQPERLRALALNNCLVETAKIFWRRSRLGELAASCERLAAKWPHCLLRGPFHAAEAAWLAGRGGELPAGGTLRRIGALHVLAGHVPAGPVLAGPGLASRALADELYAGRQDALARPPAAAARDLAMLGELLAALAGERGRAGQAADCLALAHATARQVDPGLANQVRDRWLAALPGAPDVPGELNAARLGATDLRAARDLAVARFGG